MTRRTLFAFAVAATVLITPNAGRAQEKSGEGVLTAESLKTILEGLGHDIEKDVKNKDGKVIGYQIELKQPKSVTHPQITISSDGTVFWISAALSKVENIDAVPKSILGEMMIANDKMGPCFFHFDSSNNFFYISTFTMNKAIKPKDVKRSIDTVAGNVEQYENLWLPDKWPEAKKK